MAFEDPYVELYIRVFMHSAQLWIATVSTAPRPLAKTAAGRIWFPHNFNAGWFQKTSARRNCGICLARVQRAIGYVQWAAEVPEVALAKTPEIRWVTGGSCWIVEFMSSIWAIELRKSNSYAGSSTAGENAIHKWVLCIKTRSGNQIIRFACHKPDIGNWTLPASIDSVTCRRSHPFSKKCRHTRS